MKKYESDFDTSNAHLEDGSTIFIDDAESGKKGYYCLGCKRELVAVKRSRRNWLSYFRHYVEDSTIGTKCTYRDETYRHKIAKEVLQRMKRIRVPDIVKFPPPNVEGLVNILQESRIIEAAYVENELQFYEDVNGEIHHGRNVEIDEKFLLIQPDVIFFDDEGNPILFIEIVATHDVKEEKRVKIRHLGIDTISVKIPRMDLNQIDHLFEITKNTKWIYSHVEQSTPYVPISAPHRGEISPIDPEQAKLFEENFRCRRAEISFLIRSISRCLESESYRQAEQRFRAEISRVEGNTATHGRRREIFQEQCRKTIEGRIGVERGELENKERELEREEDRLSEQEGEIDRQEREIEDNYLRETERLEREERDVDDDYLQQADELTAETRILSNPESELFEEGIRITGDLESRIEDARAERKGIEDRIGKLADNLGWQNSRRIEEIRKLEESIRGSQEDFDAGRAELPKKYRDIESRVREEYEAKSQRTIEQIASGDGGLDHEYSTDINRLISLRKQIGDYPEIKRLDEKYTRARELFKAGAWKAWENS